MLNRDYSSGRFDDSVIEERRKSAELVLKFATDHPALLRSAVFKEFFQVNFVTIAIVVVTMQYVVLNLSKDLRPIDSTSEIKYLKQAPLKPNVRQERKSLECDPGKSYHHGTKNCLEKSLQLVLYVYLIFVSSMS